ncbi:hypothetical protein DX873_04085 [Flagellimonas nanhaiensis]|uniref:Right-handed parallel beta-helix repeat-containing protein n=1 Tax=Flagellimonas nanhaiensis TaxID=2292706 RepID=A0A371JW53_9FLAO|nr:hypothetical protein DX873_04085 [Allomuricauda nanhaiensis]
MKWLATGLVLGLLILSASCREDFEYAPSSGNLEFSKDTVFLDTIFSNIGSSTYSLKVYNRSSEDILIPYVGLETGQQSSYRLNVDGMAGKEFQDIPLLAKDSLFVFIETTFDATGLPENEFLYIEDLLFGEGSAIQQVPLVTLVKDAVFLFPATLPNGNKESLVLGTDENGGEIRVEGFYLEPDELLFTNEKPYVIYGYAAVADGTTLSMEPGTRVHFHQNAGLVVDSGASIMVNGALSEDQEELENEVIFEGDRLETTYAQEPGQWGTVWIKEGSTGNHLSHLTIKNATTGLRVDGDGQLATPTLTLTNTQIYNSVNDNLWATSAYITAKNTVLGNAGGASARIDLGGNYSFVHCTLANYWSNGFRSGPTLTIGNYDGDTTQNLEQADFINSIVHGTLPLELTLLQDPAADFNFKFLNCLLQFDDSNNSFANDPLYDFGDTNSYENIILNQSPEFSLPFDNQFQIGFNSAALDAATPDLIDPIPFDILGIDRTQNPDLGAYEFVNEN